jgi:glycosyltransferase involved in cell wall biosynthesis
MNPPMPQTVTLLRGHQVNPWELGSWRLLGPQYRVRVLVTKGARYEAVAGLEQIQVATLGDRLAAGPPGRLLTRAAGERYLGLAAALAGSDIVHAAELGYWFSAQAAALKRTLGFKLALTVWETLPFADSYRNVRTRRYRRDVLAATDLFLATTERARRALLLEGAPPERIVVCQPGIDVERFAGARSAQPRSDGRHVILSVGRLVWEKGHQDLLRALALLRVERGLSPLAMIVGVGPEEKRLRAYAAELGLADAVEFAGAVPYAELPSIYARASCLVLASIPLWHWEEQFGMVLAEAMAAHLPILASTSGAIGEVVGGDATAFAPGDWVGLARALAEGPLARPPGERSAPAPERVELYSSQSAAQRLRDAYERLAPGGS